MTKNGNILYFTSFPLISTSLMLLIITGGDAVCVASDGLRSANVFLDVLCVLAKCIHIFFKHNDQATVQLMDRAPVTAKDTTLH